MKKLLEWLLSFFASKEEKKAVARIDKLKQELKEIRDEKPSDDDILDHFND